MPSNLTSQISVILKNRLWFTFNLHIEAAFTLFVITYLLNNKRY